MVQQYIYGKLLRMEGVAGENLPYHRFIGIENDKFVLAKDSLPIVGVTVPSVQDIKMNANGTTKRRDGYYKDEQPQILHSGACHVELEGEIGKGERMTLGSEGKAKKAGKTEVVIAMASEKKGKGNVEVVLKI